jgi:hypothetical protein
MEESLNYMGRWLEIVMKQVIAVAESWLVGAVSNVEFYIHNH